MTPHPRLEVVLGRARAVDLADLDGIAALLTRRDRKYLVPVGDGVRLVESLASSTRVLAIAGRRSFCYETVYFDTPERESYLAAARDRPWRYKVRTRSYLDTGRCVLEIKTRNGRGRTVKAQREYDVALRERLSDAAVSFVSSCSIVGPAAARLEPVLRTRYVRSTLLLADQTRFTIDVNVQAAAFDGRTVSLADMAVIETKSGGAPSEADRALWALGYRPIRLSKFCTSLAALDPALPSNKWTQALRRPWVVSGARVHAAASSPPSNHIAQQPAATRSAGLCPRVQSALVGSCGRYGVRFDLASTLVAGLLRWRDRFARLADRNVDVLRQRHRLRARVVQSRRLFRERRGAPRCQLRL